MCQLCESIDHKLHENLYIEIEYIEFYFIYKDFLKMRVSYAVLYSNSWIQHVCVCLKMNNFVLFSEWCQYIQVRYSDLKFWFDARVPQWLLQTLSICKFSNFSVHQSHIIMFSLQVLAERTPPPQTSISTPRIDDSGFW